MQWEGTAECFDLGYKYVAAAPGCHLDGKNTPGSYSALVVFETQEAFVGSHYMLPQYRMGLDVRQGMPGLLGPLCVLT